MAQYIKANRILQNIFNWQCADSPNNRMTANEYHDADIKFRVLGRIARDIRDELEEDAVEVIFCKDCAKHNIDIGDVKSEPSEPGGMYKFYWKDEACPLVQYRGKAQGHEFDYQFCCCGIRKENP